MRIKAVLLSSAVLCAAALIPHQAEARAKGGGPFSMSASTVGFSGGAIIGAHASPYYYAPYGYAPAYYHGVPYGYANYGYGYSYGYPAPVYAYSAPYAYAVAAPCWSRRQAVYGTYGEVAAIRYESSCQ